LPGGFAGAASSTIDELQSARRSADGLLGLASALTRPHIRRVGKERAIWTGAISFGLVNIPVRLYSATKSHDVAFHQFEEKTGQRIHNKRVGERNGREVPYDKIVKGYEVSKGKVVLIEPKELETLEPKKTRTIELEQFVDMHEIDPIFWDQTYYLGPENSPGAQKSYQLLRRAMQEMERVGVGRFVLRTKEYLATIRPLGAGLALETMFFPDEIRDLDEVVGEGKKAAPAPRELTMAKQLIKSLEAKWDPRDLKDTYRDRVLDLIHRKARGEEIVREEQAEPDHKVIDLMEALKASLGSGNGRRQPRSAGKNSDRNSGKNSGKNSESTAESSRTRKHAGGPKRRTTGRHRAHAA
jgi:DNA end-binding protein Ku